MARDNGSYTVSNPPVTDPLLALVASATSTSGNATLTYTTTGEHKLSVGQPVTITGFSGAYLNFDPNAGTTTANGALAVVASVVSSTVFTVKSPLGTAVATSQTVTGGTVTQQALVSKSPYGTATSPRNWLPTTAQWNPVVAREWGNTNPIQPNKESVDGDLRAQVTPLATSAPSGNGAQVTYTVASHSFVPGQRVSIQGVVPDSYNLKNVVVAATTSTTIVVNSALTAPVTSYANGGIVAVNRVNGTFPRITSAIGAAGTTPVNKTTSSALGANVTSVGVNNTSGIVVGGSVTATTGIAQNTVVTAIGANTVTISPATTGNIANGAPLTFGTGFVNLYTTEQPHGLVAGQNVSVVGASPVTFNVSGAVANTTPTTFSVAAPIFKIVKVSGTSPTAPGVVGDGSNVLYYTDSAHNFAAGDTVSVVGFTPTAYNVVGTVAASPAPTSNTFAIATNATATVTSYGHAVENSGTFSGPARISIRDASWNSAYVTPSGYLDPSLDNHDRVTNPDSGYPDFTPTYTIPDVRGFTITNAIQKIRAAGMQPGNIDFGINTTGTASSGTTTVNVSSTTGIYVGQTVTGTAGVTAAIVATNYVASIGSGTVTLNATTAAAISSTAPITFITDMVGTSITTTPTSVTITVPNAAHYLAVGDTVTLSNSSNASLKGDWTVAAIPTASSFTLNIPGVTGVAGGVIIRPKNTDVTAQSPSAGSTTATFVNLVRNYGL